MRRDFVRRDRRVRGRKRVFHGFFPRIERFCGIWAFFGCERRGEPNRNRRVVANTAGVCKPGGNERGRRDYTGACLAGVLAGDRV